jgi:hypothetical protein
MDNSLRNSVLKTEFSIKTRLKNYIKTLLRIFPATSPQKNVLRRNFFEASDIHGFRPAAGTLPIVIEVVLPVQKRSNPEVIRLLKPPWGTLRGGGISFKGVGGISPIIVS